MKKMKRILQVSGLWVLLLVVLGIVYLAISGRKMQTVKTKIEISAPPAKVWAILTDINKGQEWSPIINASNE